MNKWILLPIVFFVLLSGCLNVESRNATDNNPTNSTGRDVIGNNLTGNKPEQGNITLQGLTFNTDIGTSFEMAKSAEKPVFIYARSKDCGYCKKFEAETFTNQTVIKTLNEKFILVSIDVQKQQNETINLRVHGTPTEIFLDPNGVEIKRIRGYTETQSFLDTIDQILK